MKLSSSSFEWNYFYLSKKKKIEEEGLKEHGQGGELQQNGPLYNKIMDPNTALWQKIITIVSHLQASCLLIAKPYTIALLRIVELWEFFFVICHYLGPYHWWNHSLLSFPTFIKTSLALSSLHVTIIYTSSYMISAFWLLWGHCIGHWHPCSC